VVPSQITRTFKSIPYILGLAIIPFFVFAVIGWYILDFIAGLGIASAFGNGYAVNFINGLKSTMAGFDLIIMFTLGIFLAAIFVRSFRTRTHPVLGVVGLLALPLFVIGASMVANFVSVFTTFGFLSEALNKFTYTVTFFKSTATVTTAVGVLVLLVMVGGGVLARRA